MNVNILHMCQTEKPLSKGQTQYPGKPFQNQQKCFCQTWASEPVSVCERERVCWPSLADMQRAVCISAQPLVSPPLRTSEPRHLIYRQGLIPGFWLANEAECLKWLWLHSTTCVWHSSTAENQKLLLSFTTDSRNTETKRFSWCKLPLMFLKATYSVCEITFDETFTII